MRNLGIKLLLASLCALLTLAWAHQGSPAKTRDKEFLVNVEPTVRHFDVQFEQRK